MKSKKDTKKIQVKQRKKIRKNETNKRKTKKESCKIGSGRTRITARKRRKNRKKCAICLGKIRNYDLVETECNHPFHFNCLKQWCERNRRKTIVPCPYCRQPINEDCSMIHQIDYELQFREGEPILPMVDIPRWYTGNTYEHSPHTPTESPNSSRENSISSSAEPGESFFYDSPPDESTMDVVEIIEPLEPNISNSLSPIQPTNSLSPVSRINRNQYDETLNRIYDRLRQ